MCGITGFVDFSGKLEKETRLKVLAKMTGTLHHRGPDHTGLWVDEHLPVALGHQRLSILDLSPEGHQPMHSACGRFVIVFNGEIYNFSELRAELEKEANPHWRGHSDTEIVLAAVSHWGIQPTLKRLVGMFAIALWDKKERLLYLVRDRLGEKPLYYGWNRNTFLFGSELKALRAFPDWQGEICRESLLLYLRYSCIPAPHSIFHGIYKVFPGTMVCLSFRSQAVSKTVFWSVKEGAAAGLSDPLSLSEDEFVDRLDMLLRKTIERETIADVPLGAFLSGGIDSSLIVALMQAQSNSKVKTFTIGFPEKEFDEAVYAKQVANHLGTEHTEMYVTRQDIMSVIPRLPDIYDEPFADSSQVPTYLVAKLTRNHVTVCLSGDGGDELFGGYTRYFMFQKLWKKLGILPPLARQFFGRILKRVPAKAWDSLPANVSSLLFPLGQSENLGGKLAKLSEVLLSGHDVPSFYHAMISNCKDPLLTVLDVKNEPPIHDCETGNCQTDLIQQLMVLDQYTLLPDDILAKVDRAGMAVSLETRMPFLDHRIVEFSWKVPISLNVQNGHGKMLLRKVLKKYLPQSLIDRKKMGFSIPLGDWLRGPLRDWAESLLNFSKLKQDGFFDPRIIHKRWNEHQTGIRNWQYHLWDVLMFQSWLGT